MPDRAKETESRFIGKIPVANIWLLFLYASQLARFRDEIPIRIEDDDTDLPSLIARVLIYAVEQRLRRNLSRGYLNVTADLGRVRGRIDCLGTYSRDLLRRGQVRCRFEDLTMDTPRNRYVRSALLMMGGRLKDKALSHDCRRLAGDLGRLGVSDVRPSRSERALDVIGRNEVHDRLMVALSDLAFDLALPTEEGGATQFTSAVRDQTAQAMGALFERAVRGFYEIEFRRDEGWLVSGGTSLQWPSTEQTPGILAILPKMRTDIVIDDLWLSTRVVIDTKYANIISKGRFRPILNSNYIYQIYAYLRSQEERDTWWRHAEGLLIHPTVDKELDESFTIQGHKIRFATVDLMAPTMSIRQRLITLVSDPLTDRSETPAVGGRV